MAISSRWRHMPIHHHRPTCTRFTSIQFVCVVGEKENTWSTISSNYIYIFYVCVFVCACARVWVWMSFRLHSMLLEVNGTQVQIDGNNARLVCWFCSIRSISWTDSTMLSSKRNHKKPIHLSQTLTNQYEISQNGIRCSISLSLFIPHPANDNENGACLYWKITNEIFATTI